MNERLLGMLPQPIRSLFWRIGVLFDRHAKVAFSQEGEDLLIGRLFDGQTTGFYVDVGAHHPTRFSNTYLLYRKGWSGINIDASPGSMEAFERKRPRDVNLEIAVADTHGTIELHRFAESALNTASAELANDRIADSDQPLLDVVSVAAAPLEAILDEHMPPSTTLDLMSIDVEGRDFDVIRSNNWDRYRPRVLVIEVLETTLANLATRPEIEFLSAIGYKPHSKLHNSVILRDATVG